MCRNIRLLHHFEPPTSDNEIRDAAVQFVRKVSGLNAPSQVDREVFEKAVADIAACTKTLLTSLTQKGPPHTRESEREKAKIKWAKRESRMRGA
ncbi:MAG: DUF2277 domain-containing protein [Polyangiaceae bacterium]|nr:DUF2277 domain-containing protein [Polyangiaceae bacterium]